jgi:hypothetical protein
MRPFPSLRLRSPDLDTVVPPQDSEAPQRQYREPPYGPRSDEIKTFMPKSDHLSDVTT